MLDKQYSRVIRWIYRAQSMSADGKYSDAILDVECARAELDDARQELLLCHGGASERKIWGSELRRSFVSALFVLLLTASPLQRAERLTVGRVAASAQVLKKNDAHVREGAEEKFVKTAECLPIETAADGRAVKSRGESCINKVLPMGREREFGTKLSERDVYRLVEVGRKALQHNKSTLAVEFN